MAAREDSRTWGKGISCQRVGKDTKKMMSNDEIRRFTNSLSALDLATFVSLIAVELTISARDTYEAGTDRVLDGPRLRMYNEALHRVVQLIPRTLQEVDAEQVQEQLLYYYSQSFGEGGSEFDKEFPDYFERAVEMLDRWRKSSR